MEGAWTVGQIRIRGGMKKEAWDTEIYFKGR